MNRYSTNVLFSVTSIFQKWNNTDAKWFKDPIFIQIINFKNIRDFPKF